jgi:hypothetical protein
MKRLQTRNGQREYLDTYKRKYCIEEGDFLNSLHATSLYEINRRIKTFSARNNLDLA